MSWIRAGGMGWDGRVGLGCGMSLGPGGVGWALEV